MDASAMATCKLALVEVLYVCVHLQIWLPASLPRGPTLDPSQYLDCRGRVE